MNPTSPQPQVPAGWQQPPTLEYSIPQRTRPGILTAVGVISIVLGSLSILRSVWQMISIVGMLLISQMNFPVVTGTAGGGMTPAGAITAEDAGVIVAALDAAQALSEADQARMASALSQANVPLAPPPAGEAWTAEHVAGQITAVTSTGSSLTYSVAGGSIRIDPVKIEFNAASGGTGISTTTVSVSGNVTGFSMAGNPFGAIKMAPLIASFAVELPNLGLAILLLIAGIVTLRASPRSPLLHRYWAWLKLPAIALSTAIGIWQALTFMNSLGMTATQTTGGATVTGPIFPGGFGWLMIIPAVFTAMIASVYPIAVLIIFRTRRVREHYGSEAAA